MKLTRHAKTFVGMMVLVAAIVGSAAIQGQTTWHPFMALTLLLSAVATSRMKVKLPGLTGNMSVNLPFLLLSVVTLNASEAILIACASAIEQTLPRDDAKLKPAQLVFNICVMTFSCGAAGLFFHAPVLARLNGRSMQLMLTATTVLFFIGQTVPVSMIIALTDEIAPRRVWTRMAQLSFPYYVVSAGVASMVISLANPIGWPAALTVLPIMYGIYRSYQLYFAKTARNAQESSAMAAGAGSAG
jgi:hypothetical protein